MKYINIVIKFWVSTSTLSTLFIAILRYVKITQNVAIYARRYLRNSMKLPVNSLIDFIFLSIKFFYSLRACR